MRIILFEIFLTPIVRSLIPNGEVSEVAAVDDFPVLE